MLGIMVGAAVVGAAVFVGALGDSMTQLFVVAPTLGLRGGRRILDV